jgi:hypothetical protein
MNKTKTNHQTGYHKPVVNPTTNYPKDSHKAFCKRCLERYHEGICPITGTSKASSQCDI